MPIAAAVVLAAGFAVVLVVLSSRTAPPKPGRAPAVSGKLRRGAQGFPERIFSPHGVWNARLSDDAPLDRRSRALVGSLRQAVTEDLAKHRGPWIATDESSTPLYRVGAEQPLVRVQLDTGSWGATLQQAFEAVPLPDDARPADGADGHLAVWQPATDRYWEFFHLRNLSDGWHADFGGAIQHVSTSPGYYDRSSWPGLSQPYWGATASSLPMAAGLMRIDELKAGHIDHALTLAVPAARAHTYSWPAQRTDGTSTSPDAVPEGAHFRLDPSLDLTKLDLAPMTRMIAQAAQRYGLIVVDQTGWAVGLVAEDPTPTGSDPYYGPNGLFDNQYPSQLLAKFPWQHLQLLQMHLHTG